MAKLVDKVVSEPEQDRRRDDALRRALAMPPKPHGQDKGKGVSKPKPKPGADRPKAER